MVGVREVYAEVAAEQALQAPGLVLKVEQRRARWPRMTDAAKGYAPAEKLAREIMTACASGMTRPAHHIDLRRSDPVTGVAIYIGVFFAPVSKSGALFCSPSALRGKKGGGFGVRLVSHFRA